MRLSLQTGSGIASQVAPTQVAALQPLARCHPLPGSEPCRGTGNLGPVRSVD